MLRYKTKTRPGLVTLYDIRPGNEAGPFLQPQSPHGAFKGEKVNSQGTGAYCVGLPHSLFFFKIQLPAKSFKCYTDTVQYSIPTNHIWQLTGRISATWWYRSRRRLWRSHSVVFLWLHLTTQHKIFQLNNYKHPNPRQLGNKKIISNRFVKFIRNKFFRAFSCVCVTLLVGYRKGIWPKTIMGLGLLVATNWLEFERLIAQTVTKSPSLLTPTNPEWTNFGTG